MPHFLHPCSAMLRDVLKLFLFFSVIHLVILALIRRRRLRAFISSKLEKKQWQGAAKESVSQIRKPRRKTAVGNIRKQTINRREKNNNRGEQKESGYKNVEREIVKIKVK